MSLNYVASPEAAERRSTASPGVSNPAGASSESFIETQTATSDVPRLWQPATPIPPFTTSARLPSVAVSHNGSADSGNMAAYGLWQGHGNSGDKAQNFQARGPSGHSSRDTGARRDSVCSFTQPPTTNTSQDSHTSSVFSSADMGVVSSVVSASSPRHGLHAPSSADRAPTPTPNQPYELVVNQKRPRTHTVDLASPLPETHPTKYTDERVQDGIDYAGRRLKSTCPKPPPIQEKLLLLYRGACAEYLEEKKKISRDEDQRLERLREYGTTRQRCLTEGGCDQLRVDAEQNLQDTLLRLKKFELLARYADYCQRMCTKIGNLARKHGTNGWQHLSSSHTWLQISKCLKEEEGHWEEHGTSKGFDMVETTSTLWGVCNKAGMNFQCAVLAIHMYATRNQLMHSNTVSLVADGNWAALAKRLHDDLIELPCVLPIEYLKRRSV